MDFNRESILDELNDFEKRSNEVSPLLEDYLLKIAKTGDTMFPWNKLKPLLRRKLELVLNDFYETCPTDNLPPLPNVENFKYDHLKAKILEAVDSFQSAPFTIQRLCELVTSPRKHYKRTDKFMRGLEKNILVVSTVEPKSPLQNEVNNNSNPTIMVNGLISTTTNSPPSNIVNDNNGNTSPSHITTTMKSSVNGTVPLDNFANVFPSAPCITTSSDIHISSVSSQSQSFDNPDSVEDFHSSSNANNDPEDKANRLSIKSDSQLADSAMDTSPDPSESSDEAENCQTQENSFSPDHTSPSSASDSTAQLLKSLDFPQSMALRKKLPNNEAESAQEISYSEPSLEEPSSTDPSNIAPEEPLSEVEVASDEKTVEQSTLSTSDSSTELGGEVSTDIRDMEEHKEESTEENEQEREEPNHIVTSSQGEGHEMKRMKEEHSQDDPVSQSHLQHPDSIASTRSTESAHLNKNISTTSSSADQDSMDMEPPSTSEEKDVSNSIQSRKDATDSSEAEAMEQD